MRHISPKEMESMLGSIPVSRVIFKRPAAGSGVVLEMLAANGEEIMISEQGTPDPVVFTSPDVMTFFRELGFFSGQYDDVILDATQYRPAGFGFMQVQPEKRFGDIRKREEAGDALDYADEQPRELQQSQFTTTTYTLSDVYAQPEFPVDDIAEKGLETLEHGEAGEKGELEEEEEAPEPKIGEKYLTTINLIRVTSAMVTFELVVLLFMPAMPETMRDIMYMCAGTLVVLALSFIFFERRNPDHPSLRVRRYIWLCLVVFNFSMVLSYMMGSRMLG